MKNLFYSLILLSIFSCSGDVAYHNHPKISSKIEELEKSNIELRAEIEDLKSRLDEISNNSNKSTNLRNTSDSTELDLTNEL